jgi:hypothetical protein
MAPSFAGMALAAAGYLPPVAGAGDAGDHRHRSRFECSARRHSSKNLSDF